MRNEPNDGRDQAFRKAPLLSTTCHFLSLIRFSHTLFALPFALLAAVMAWHQCGWQDEECGFNGRILIGILLCMVTARSTAMAFNRLVDHKIDAQNPRTSGRHLPAGTLSLPQVITFTAACGLAFVGSTLLFLPNPLPLYLSLPVLAFLCGYSFAKRFTAFAHFWLGTALALSPVAVWIAVRGEIVLQNPADLLPALVLGGVVVSWVTGFDIIYACQDFEFDRSHGLYSIPAKLGIPRALQLAAACHAFTVVFLGILPSVYPHFGTLYWIAVTGVALLLIYEHSLVRPEDLDRVNTAFFHVNAVISLGLFAVSTLDLWLGSGR